MSTPLRTRTLTRHGLLTSALALTLAGCGSESAPDGVGTADAGIDAAPTTVAPVLVEGSGCEACDGACSAATLEYASRNHLPGAIEYVDLPPAGGDHDRCWAVWGVYDEPLPPRHWVHNMEHGGVVAVYDCPQGCEDDVASLEEWVLSLGNSAILTPLAGFGARFGVVAWGRRLTMDCLDLDAMRDFYDRFVDQGPESTTSMPPGTCMEP